MVVVEGQLAAQQNIHDDACAPDVDLGPGVQPDKIISTPPSGSLIGDIWATHFPEMTSGAA